MRNKELFKERRKARKERRKEYKQARTDSFLIVTEGTKTEPFYFQGLKTRVLDSVEGKIDVVPLIEIQGEGKNTESLVEAAVRLNRNADIIYQHIWVVMDKDDFPNFDQAISKAESMGFHAAWSNQSFEYWIYLHFHYTDAAMHRDELNRKLSQIFKDNNIGEGKYQKDNDNIYEDINKGPGSTSRAIANAKKRMTEYDPRKTSPSKYDPGTTVHVLVEQLMNYINAEGVTT